MPPAFNLSQDQTLEFNLASIIAAQSSTRASRRKTRFECGRKPTFVGNLNCPRTPSFDSEGRPSHRRRNAHSTRLKFGVKPPRKKILKIFRKARFFLRGPGRSAKAPSSGKRRILHSRKQKASPSAKNCGNDFRSSHRRAALAAMRAIRTIRENGPIAQSHQA